MSQDAATRCIQVPRFEATDAIQIARKSVIRSGLHGDVTSAEPSFPRHLGKLDLRLRIA